MKLISVHGTGAGADSDAGEMWWQTGSPFQKRLAELLDLEGVELVPFHWGVGPNSELERRKAGRNLYALLRRFDKEGQDYCLLGHSHGGSVIYHALLRSVVYRRPLKRLRAWHTVGTPFVDAAPHRFLFSRLDAPGLTVFMFSLLLMAAAVVFLGSHVLGTELARLIDQKLHGAALGHLYLPILLSTCGAAVMAYAVLFAYEWWRDRWISDRTKRKTAELYSALWTGYAHEDDEAIAALRNASSFKPEIVPHSFLVQTFALIPIVIFTLSLAWLLYDVNVRLAQPLERLESVAELIRNIPYRDIAQVPLTVPRAGEVIEWLVLLCAILLLATFVVFVFKTIGYLIGRPLAGVIDRIVWRSVREQVWGDDLAAEDVRGVSSSPPMFVARYLPLGRPISDAILASSDENASATLRRLRVSLCIASAPNRSGDFLTTALNQLSWRELVHNTYFNVDEFARLLAYALSKSGLAKLRTTSWSEQQIAAASQGHDSMLAAGALGAQNSGVTSAVVATRASPVHVSQRAATFISIAIPTLVFVGGIALTSLVIPLHWAAIIWIGAIALIVLLAEIIPVSTAQLSSNPAVARTFEEATQRFSELSANTEAAIHPRCVPFLLHHGARTQRAYVLCHGISNCPFSMTEIAKEIHSLGHNVIVARMPQNGHVDNTTDALRHLTAVQLRAYADTSIDIAAGLGERVHVIGISAGAVIAGWIAQNRREIDRAVLISPAYGLHSLGTSLNNTLMRLTLLLPNFSVWNDPIHKSTGAGRPHSYMRQSTRSIGEVMRLGLATLRQATATPAASRSITIITNAADTVVDLTMPDQLAKQWEQHATPVTRFTFAKELALPHEMIDPTQEGARTSISYPKIIELAERSPEATDARPRKADV